MKDLKLCFEEGEVGGGLMSTPANTMGIGNPDISHDNLSEPIPTAKSQVEKDKKKRKRKMKSLAESLFDKDLVTRSIPLGDFIKLEEWEPADYGDRDLQDNISIIFSLKMAKSIIRNSKWSKFLKPFEHVYKNRPSSLTHEYWYEPLFWYLTWVIMCCENNKEIENKVKEFIEDSRYPRDTSNLRVEVAVLPSLVPGQKHLPRMVILKFIAPDDTDTMVWAKIKKKD